MSGFLYFIPAGAEKFSNEYLSKIGITEIDAMSCVKGPVENGPNGGKGLFVMRKEGRNKLATDAYNWIACNDEKFWLGIHKDNPPTPSELKRNDVAPCNKYTLFINGQHWEIPCAPAIPYHMTPVAGGGVARVQMGGRDFDKLNEIGETVDRHFQAVAAAEKGDTDLPVLTDKTKFDIFCFALGFNYYLGPWEIGALQMATETNITFVLMAVVDSPVLADIFGKSAESQEIKKN